MNTFILSGRRSDRTQRLTNSVRHVVCAPCAAGRFKSLGGSGSFRVRGHNISIHLQAWTVDTGRRLRGCRNAWVDGSISFTVAAHTSDTGCNIAQRILSAAEPVFFASCCADSTDKPSLPELGEGSGFRLRAFRIEG